MKAKFTINVNALNSVDASSIDGFVIEWLNVTDRVNFSSWFQDEDLLSIVSTHDEINFNVEYSQGGGGQSLDRDFEQLSTNGIWIRFTAECDYYPEIQTLLNLGVIMDITPLTGETLIYFYKLNSANNVLNKDIELVNVINGKFNHLVGLKTLNLDIFHYQRNSNYVYIPSLSRYYFIDSIEFVSADYTRLHLREDVLMSWQDLIKNQGAFVTRREVGNNSNILKDDRLPLEDKISYEYFDSSIRHGNLKNVTFDYSTDANKYACISYTSVDSYAIGQETITAPTGSGLPDVISYLNNKTCISFLTRTQFERLIYGLYLNSAQTSYVENLLWLPFDPTSVFLIRDIGKCYVGGKVLSTTGTWVDYDSTSADVIKNSRNLNSPYLIIADIMFNGTGGIVTPTPAKRMLYYNSYWEIYIPFVGWVEVKFSQVFNKRILVYYTMDLRTGISTAYIYNYTDKKVIYSTSCQLGIKLDISSSNALENTRQKQANDLNMLISGLSSAVSIGVGVATENPVAIAGGILSAGKSIASYVNNNNMIIERANTSFGTSDGALYSQNFVSVRRSYHAPITIDATTYARMQGYPYNGYIDSFTGVTGYVEIGEIQFNPMNEEIYQDEINEIVSLLKNGVIM